MNEQLQKELALWLSSLREAAQAGAGFALDQAPLIVREKVLYGRVSSTLWVIIGVVLFVVFLRQFRRHWAVYEKARSKKGFADVWIELDGAGASSVSMIGCVVCALFARYGPMRRLRSGLRRDST